MPNNVIETILTVLAHPILKEYPLKTPYLTKFLKKIINQVCISEIIPSF